MPPRRRRARVQTTAASAKQRDQDTTRLINEALAGEQNIAQLRKLAAVRGLVNNELRARLWPTLLGSGSEAHASVNGSLPALARASSLGRRCSTDLGSGRSSPAGTLAQLARSGSAGGKAALAAGPEAGDGYEQWAEGEHRDRTTVRVDVERSLHSFAAFLSSDERAARRLELQRLLNAVVVKHDGAVHYYQGLHDVASVLLLVAGEAPAFDMLCRLSLGHLRDATRATLDPVLELLGLMGHVVAAADPELAALLGRLGLPPFYALSWFITWFAHDLADFGEVCRLFDLFLATHPLMPLYVGAVAMHSQRSQLLAAEEMPQLHSTLVNLRITKRASADQLAVQAIELFKRASPHELIASRQLHLQLCVAPRAALRSGSWQYPEPRAAGPGLWSQQRLHGLLSQMARLPLPGTPAQRKKLVMASLTGVLGSIYVVAVCIFMAKQPGTVSPLAMLQGRM